MGTCLRFESSPEATFLLADQGSITPIVIDGHADQSVHIAVATLRKTFTESLATGLLF
jgi:hypothetical protein